MLAQQIIGTVEQYPTKAVAARAIEALKLTVNQQGFQRKAGPKTFPALVEHYRLKDCRKTIIRKRPARLRKCMNPACGIMSFQGGAAINCGSSPVSRSKNGWISLSWHPAPRAKIRNVMSTIFRHGIRWGWIGQQENPVAMVRVSSKRLRTPDILDAEEFQLLFARLPDGNGQWGLFAPQPVFA
jgi:hypothetical protein